ncbi:MAG: hypothetical protein GXO89_09970 [Chlorobi bacterium]|nr:hypothetical protein [Chlorobiota bacterium]
MKLQEGKNYLFRLEGLVELPDGQLFHRLSDPNNVKHLLPAEPYGKYGLESKDEIICHVDKINCSGKIFLEPEHPMYKVGEKYPFEVVGFESIENSDGYEENEILVVDKFGKTVNVPEYWFPNVKNKGKIIWCRVGRIKKGNLILTPVTDPDNTQNLKPGDEIEVTIDEIKTLSGDVEFFVLIDKEKNNYYLRKKFYAEYDLKKGQLITCRVMLQNDEIFLEPHHPYYSLGKAYDFKVLRDDVIEDYPEKNVPVLVVADVYKKEYYLRKDQLGPAKSNMETLNCIVAEIVKGRLVLQCL